MNHEPDEFPTRTSPRLHGAMPIWHGTVDAAQLRAACASRVRAAAARLIALWGSDERAREPGFALHAALIGLRPA